MNITIREAVISDHESLCRIYEELDTLHRTNHSDLFIQPDGCARAREYVSDILLNSEKALFVAVADGSPVGFAECYVQRSSAFPVVRKREWVQLDNIAVLEAYRAHHIGSLLLKRVAEWAKSRHIDRLELKVYSFNESAIAFYAGKGFKELSKTMFLDLP